MMGFEPMTPCLQGRCSPNWATPPWCMSLFSVHFFNELYEVPQKLNNNNFFVKPPIRSTVCPRSAVLLRKEVIQPHLPIRLPCYDLTPIIEPTLGSYLTRLVYWLWVFPTFMVWRAVCTKPGNVFTVACWSTITSNSNFMQASFSLQSELGRLLWDLLHLAA